MIIEDMEPKKRGRPRTRNGRIAQIILPKATEERIDAYREKLLPRPNRSAAIIGLVEKALTLPGKAVK